MALQLLFGDDVDVSFLDRLVEVDHACYEPEYWGDPRNTQARYLKNRRSFVFVLDAGSDRLAGYLNFFPCERSLYLDNLSRSPVIRDDDITPDEVADYRTDENHLFIISMAIHPDYQGGEAVRLLTNGFIDYLGRLRAQGYPITDIMGTAVSAHGRKAMGNLLFRRHRELDDGNTVYVCDGSRLDKLLANDLYFKTYQDDLWILLPLAEHKANLRIANLFSDLDGKDWEGGPGARCRPAVAPEGDPSGEPAGFGRHDEVGRSVARRVIDALRECFAYECSNEVVRDLEFAYLGSYDFLHTTDEYEGQHSGNEVVMGLPHGHAILVAHRRTHMFVVALVLPSYPHSTTQMEDQVSYDYLKIRDPQSGSFIPFYSYLLKTYGLHRCGPAKCLLYLAGKPHDERELQDMLAAESYDNYGREYRMASPELALAATQNRAVYDYYEVYLSSRAIVYVAKEYSDEMEDRIFDFANYLFVVMLVLFQNTALAKVNMRVTDVLETNRDISPKAKLAIDREYGQTIRFWEVQNFKYLSTQIEGTYVREAFLNKELSEIYSEHQGFLEHLVSVKSAIAEGRTGMVINVVAVILAAIQLEPVFTDLLMRLYSFLGIEAAYATGATYRGLFGGIALIVVVVVANYWRRYRPHHNDTGGR